VGAKTILLVDDDVDQHQTCGIYLQHLGYRVLSVTDGASAVVIATSMPVDLVLMDLHMPGENGVQVAHRLRGDPASAEIPVVLVTADAVRVRNLDTEGLRAVITKPCPLVELGEEVRRVIGDP
jgi:diguanylate cyclase